MSRINGPMAFFIACTALAAWPACGASPDAAPANDAAAGVGASLTEVQVTARHLDAARNDLMPETGSSVYRISVDDIRNLPLGDSTPLNQVLLQAPGVVQDSFGQLHVRGDHANLQYRINDVVVPEAIALFGQSLNPRFASEISMLTGALPAQYGYRTAGVVDIHSKASQFADEGRVSVLAGSRDHREASLEASATSGPLSAYATGSALGNDLGIENPAPASTAIHDATRQQSAFVDLSYVLSPSSRLTLMLAASNNTFQIPDRPGQQPAYTPPGVALPDSAQLDANQREGNRFAILAFQGSLGERLNYQVAIHDRFSDVHYRPDPLGDLNYGGVASDVTRRSNVYGLQSDASARLGDAHTLRFGLNYSHELGSSHAAAAVYPLDAAGAPVFSPLRLLDDSEVPATLVGLYLQDEWRPIEHLTVNYGARFDRIRSLVDEQQLSPRLGFVYELTPATTLHAGYARYFTPPPTEKIATETVALFASTTNAPPSSLDAPVTAERSHYFDVGVVHKLTPAASVGLDGYYCKVSRLQDEGQFGNALLFAPFNYDEGRIFGVELTTSYKAGALATYANLAYGEALGRRIVSGQFNFSQPELDYVASNWVHLDHDQRWTASAGLSDVFVGTTLNATTVFGTGLRRGFANTGHLPSYAQLNLGARRSVDLGAFGRLDVNLSLLNALDHVFELRDGSGIGVGAPQWGMRRTLYAGLSKRF